LKIKKNSVYIYSYQDLCTLPQTHRLGMIDGWIPIPIPIPISIERRGWLFAKTKSSGDVTVLHVY